MKTAFIMLLTWIIFVINSYSQSNIQSLEITKHQTENGDRIKFTSQTLGSEQEIYIGLPNNYTNSLKYPLIMVLEGDLVFESFAPITKLMAQVNEIPPCIVVGIPIPNKMYIDYAPKITGIPESGNADKMLEYYKLELFPLLDSLYNCSDDKLIWAHSGLGGTFCTYLLIGSDNQFTGILSSSPNLKFVKEYIEIENTFSQLSKKGKVFYYLTFGGNEKEAYMGSMFDDVNYFAAKLEKEKPDNLTWKYVINENNNHFSNAVETYIDGLMLYFKEMK